MSTDASETTTTDVFSDEEAGVLIEAYKIIGEIEKRSRSYDLRKERDKHGYSREHAMGIVHARAESAREALFALANNAAHEADSQSGHTFLDAILNR